MHEAGHGSLFRTRALNLWLGQWLCALPTLGDLHSYARGHQAHHRLAGTRDDPDLPNYQSYPISGASLRRKLWRDLSGQTGMKLISALLSGAASGLAERRMALPCSWLSRYWFSWYCRGALDDGYWLDLVSLDGDIANQLYVGGEVATGWRACRGSRSL